MNRHRQRLDRRAFLVKSLGVAGLSAGWRGALRGDTPEDAARLQGLRDRAPRLKITDLRAAVVKDAPNRCAIIRIETNEGLYGLGEVRNNASKDLALSLKKLVVGRNPCDVLRIVNQLKPHGGHGRQGGGVSAIEMALWDLTGKVHGLPVHELIGGKRRDRIRIYCDTTPSRNPEAYARRLKQRVEKGYTFLKMDLGTDVLSDIAGAVERRLRPVQGETLDQPFAREELTSKGVEVLAEFVRTVREAIGPDVPLAIDHLGPIGVESCIRLGRALAPHRLAWLEDVVPWRHWQYLKLIRQAVDIPILTGEEIYLRDEFARLVNEQAVDIIHPDLASVGGIWEVKQISEHAADKEVPMAMHFSGCPVACLAAVHAAATAHNFVALEFHSDEIPWWDDLVTGLPKPIIQQGYIPVPDRPGLGLDLNDAVVRKHVDGDGYFPPTDRESRR